MRHEPVDRVPVMCQLAIGHYLLNTDVPPADLWFTSEGFARAVIELADRYGFDGVLLNLSGRDPGWMRHVGRIDTADDGSQTVHFVVGDTARCPADDNVQHFAAGGNRRPSIDEVDPAEVHYDDPHGLGGLKYPFYFGLEPYRPDRSRYWPDYWFRTIDLVVGQVGGRLSVHAEVFSPFTQLMELFGYEQALMYLLDEPDRCRAILAAYTEGTADLAVRYAEHGADAVLISSAFAGGGFISPRQYREFVLPYEREVARRVHTAGVPVYTHTCGEIGDRLELMAETEIDGIDTLDPPPLGSVDLAAVFQGEHRSGEHPAAEHTGGSAARRTRAARNRRPGERIHPLERLLGVAPGAAREPHRARRGQPGVRAGGVMEWQEGTGSKPPLATNTQETAVGSVPVPVGGDSQQTTPARRASEG